MVSIRRPTRSRTRSEPVERHASRIVLVDTVGRTLLFRYRPSAPFWIVPGGGLEPGEGHLAAAVREIREETGRDVPIGPPVGHLVRTFRRRDGALVVQHERWFSACVEPFALDRDHLATLAAEGILDGRWFEPCELRASAEPLVPPRLFALVDAIITGAVDPEADLASLYGPAP